MTLMGTTRPLSSSSATAGRLLPAFQLGELLSLVTVVMRPFSFDINFWEPLWALWCEPTVDTFRKSLAEAMNLGC